MSADNVAIPQVNPRGDLLSHKEISVTTLDHVATQESPTVNAVEEKGYFRTILEAGKKAVKAAVIFAELSPVNEAIRYGALGATLLQTRDPLVAAAVLSGTTFAVEGGAVLAAADWIAQDHVGQVIDRIDQKMERYPRLHRVLSPKRFLGENIHISPVAEAGIALSFGAVAALEAKQREDPSRTAEQNRKRGLTTAVLMSGVLAVEGAGIAVGAANAGSPWVWLSGLALIGAAGAKSAFRRLRERFGKKEQDDSYNTSPRYDMSPQELLALEAELVADVKQQFTDEGIYPAFIRTDHKYANIVRMHEVQQFNEVAEISPEAEANSLFVALVDTRPSENRVVHAITVSGFNSAELELDSTKDERAGFIVIDDLIDMGNFTAEEFRQYYEAKGYDLSKCLSVETHFRIGDRPEKYNNLDPATLAYASVLKLILMQKAELGEAAIFANINRPSIVSFGRLGLKYENLMGRDNLVTSESLRDEKYKPAVIPYDAESRHLFEASKDLPTLSFLGK